MKSRSYVEPGESGWVDKKERRWERCPDCDLRGALHADGHVLKHPTHKFRLSVGCETCGNRGLVRSFDVLDAYSTGKS